MNKKLIFAMGLATTMVACNSEDVLTEVQDLQSSDMFAGIEKVDAKFAMGAESRLATEFGIEKNDRIGLAWLYDNEGKIQLKGDAYQNHPLYAINSTTLQPKTSIYVGEYFSYAPYDETVVSIDSINFTIPEKADMLSTWDGLAKDAIYISPKWTTVSKSGEGVEGEAGIEKNFTIYPRKFSNGVALEFTYKNHVIDLKDETNNDEKYPSDSEIFDAMVTYKQGEDVVSVTDFKYAPLAEAIGEDLWYDETAPVRDWEKFKLADADQTIPVVAEDGLYTVEIAHVQKDGYTLVPGKKYIATREKEGDKFFMNALPALADINDETKVEIVLNTTYGKITITKPVKEIAKTRVPVGYQNTGYQQYFDGQVVEGVAPEELTKYTESFVQVLGKNGKFETEVDLSKAVMNGMHVKNDAHLIQLLRYYRDYKLDTEYEEDLVTLYLDEDEDNEFKISKTSIALMQSINANDNKVELVVCDEHEGDHVVVVTHNEKEGKEVPSFNDVFGHELEVYLEDQDWTWNEAEPKNNGNVTKIHNRGNLTIGSTNVEFDIDETQVKTRNVSTSFIDFVNLKDAKITFTAGVASLWKINLTNNGTINIPATAHMRVYSDVVNNVTELTGVRQGNMGIIDNYGVFGAVEDQEGTIDNFGKIYHRAGAKTFITNNAENEDFSHALNEEGTKIGIIEMSEADANVSVSNKTDKGIITYTWSKDEPVYASPAVVRYNYLIVEGNIEFTESEAEIRYLEINGNDVYVTNKGKLSKLQGVIVAPGKSLNITEGNQLKPSKAAYLKGYVYNGGLFEYNKDVETYFGGEEKDIENILKWTGF